MDINRTKEVTVKGTTYRVTEIRRVGFRLLWTLAGPDGSLWLAASKVGKIPAHNAGLEAA